MAIISNVSSSEFYDRFKLHGRHEAWTRGGLRALYEYMTELYNDTGENFELDVIALDCEYVEYESFSALQNDYDVNSIDDLHDNTAVIPVEGGGLIIQQY